MSNRDDRYYRRETNDDEKDVKEEPKGDYNPDDVVLDDYNSDLNVILGSGYLSAETKVHMGFCLMWGGARATYGVNRGRAAFDVTIVRHLNSADLPTDEPDPFVARVGWSVDNSELRLGEDKLSYGYGGTGKKSSNMKFIDYGETFDAGDTITAYVDFEGKDAVVISFAKNGYDQGDAYTIPFSEIGDEALFPHVYIKNVEVRCNFGKSCTKFDLKYGFEYIGNMPVSQRIRGTLAPPSPSECEVIMMVGLPASGKTYWADKHSKSHPDKKFNVLGTNYIIDQMRVMGLPRKGNYSGRWDVLIDRATKCLNELINIASKKNRNYIIDQTNVYASARRRKMLPFLNFKRKAVVVVPTDAEFQRRINLQRNVEKKEVPESAFFEMKANFILPEVGELFDDVIFTELQYAEAKKLIDKYRMEGEANRPPPQKRIHDDRRFQRFEENKQFGYGSYPKRGRHDDGYGNYGNNPRSFKSERYGDVKVKEETYSYHGGDYNNSRSGSYYDSKDTYRSYDQNDYGNDYGRYSSTSTDSFGNSDRRTSNNARYGNRDEYSGNGYNCRSHHSNSFDSNSSRGYSSSNYDHRNTHSGSYFSSPSNFGSSNISGVYGANRSYDNANDEDYYNNRSNSRRGYHRGNYNQRY